MGSLAFTMLVFRSRGGIVHYTESYAQAGIAIPRGVRMVFFSQNPFLFTFYLQPQKVNKKGRSPNYVLHPIIWQI
jgi:hypothetical protein